MRIALALLLACTPAFAQVPLPEVPSPPADSPPAAPVEPVPHPVPVIDPAYGEQPGSADPDKSGSDTYVPTLRRGSDIVVRFHPDRTRKNIATVAVLGGAGLVVGAIGLYYHLDSRSASDAVSSKRFTGQPWTSERQELYDRAHRSARMAGVTYGIGGALVLAMAITYIATEPPLETRVIRPHEHGRPQPRASVERGGGLQVAPMRGGAFVATAWRF